MKKLLSISALVSLGFSATVVMPYGSYINYSSHASKDKAVIGGIYMSYLKSPFKFELDPETTHITYKGTTQNWNQKDLTAVFHYYKGYNWNFKAGIHSMFIDQNGNNDSYDKVLFGGILYYKYLKYNTGIDYYYSDYDHYNMKQLTPKIGFYFGNYYSDNGSFYTELKINYIRVSNQINANTNKSHYLNEDFKLSNFKGNWTTTLKISLGKNAYKVANGGFVVYNTGEEYKHSYGIDINYALSKKENIKVGFSRSTFDENGNIKNNYANAFSISFLTSF